jgi:hypothetical protein
VTHDVKGLMHALRQSINEAILDSADVAAVVEALKRTGKRPVFTIDVTLEDASQLFAGPVETPGSARELVLTDADQEFLHTLGIVPSGTTQSGTA